MQNKIQNSARVCNKEATEESVGILRQFCSGSIHEQRYETLNSAMPNKLRVFNEMIWGSNELKKKASKARAIFISNHAFVQKDRVCQATIERNWKQQKNLERQKNLQSILLSLSEEAQQEIV